MVGHRRAGALPDHEVADPHGVHVGFGHRHPVDQPLVRGPVLALGGADRRAASVRHARRDDDGVALVDGGLLDLAVLVFLTELLVEQEERELDRLQHVRAPVPLRVALRVRVLESEPVGSGRVERSKLAGAEPRSKDRKVSRRRRRCDDARDQVDRVVLQIVRACARALVRVGDRAAVLESPFARGGDRAVDAARARRRRSHDARAAPDRRWSGSAPSS